MKNIASLSFYYDWNTPAYTSQLFIALSLTKYILPLCLCLIKYLYQLFYPSETTNINILQAPDYFSSFFTKGLFLDY